MATWNDLSRYVNRQDPVQSEDDNSIRLTYATEGGRSQLVILWLHVLMEDEWVEIESPIAPISEVDAVEALREAGKLVCGGLIVTGDMLTLRHSAPLENLDTNEFEQPLAAVVITADRLEQELTGRDEF